jgi:hypothetical protein
LIPNDFEISGCPDYKPSVDDASVCAQAVGTMRSVDRVVVGVAGELATPKLVLALRHADGRLHHFAVTRPLAADVAGPVSEVAV